MDLENKTLEILDLVREKEDILIECRTALGLAKSMAEREGYDTDVYTKRIEMIDQALRIHNVVGRSEQLPHPDCDEACYYHCSKGGTQTPPDCVK